MSGAPVTGDRVSLHRNQDFRSRWKEATELPDEGLIRLVRRNKVGFRLLTPRRGRARLSDLYRRQR